MLALLAFGWLSGGWTALGGTFSRDAMSRPLCLSMQAWLDAMGGCTWGNQRGFLTDEGLDRRIVVRQYMLQFDFLAYLQSVLRLDDAQVVPS